MISNDQQIIAEVYGSTKPIVFLIDGSGFGVTACIALLVLALIMVARGNKHTNNTPKRKMLQ